jgi:hypothetical protein
MGSDPQAATFYLTEDGRVVTELPKPSDGEWAVHVETRQYGGEFATQVSIRCGSRTVCVCSRYDAERIVAAMRKESPDGK